ncbi:three-helix bundle dimerization domain-containing protein [Streptomyces erythrochromogenes]|uniref:three-helix bundle dimerization domain-containing protein n=1 Tax=Streptomyces erythrochromogenes TaxID=285574 RepID=UPI003632E040
MPMPGRTIREHHRPPERARQVSADQGQQPAADIDGRSASGHGRSPRDWKECSPERARTEVPDGGSGRGCPHPPPGGRTPGEGAPPLDVDLVRGSVQTAYEELRYARVRTCLPVLMERRARNLLPDGQGDIDT